MDGLTESSPTSSREVTPVTEARTSLPSCTEWFKREILDQKGDGTCIRPWGFLFKYGCCLWLFFYRDFLTFYARPPTYINNPPHPSMLRSVSVARWFRFGFHECESQLLDRRFAGYFSNWHTRTSTIPACFVNLGAPYNGISQCANLSVFSRVELWNLSSQSKRSLRIAAALHSYHKKKAA